MARGKSLTVHTTGFKELEQALKTLPRATEKNTMRRAARDALEPMRDKARALVADAPPAGEGLVASIIIDGKLSPRAKGMYKSEGPSEVFMHMGPAPTNAKAVVNEFGSYKMAAHPYMRPAWDSEGMATLDRLKESLTMHVMKATARFARRAAKGGKW